MVTFSRIPYKKCLQDKRWQDSVIEIGGKVCAFAFITTSHLTYGNMSTFLSNSLPFIFRMDIKHFRN